jgi:putative tricarboxylic transport membrane protein
VLGACSASEIILIRVRSPRDLLAGLLFCAVAAAAIWFSRDLEYGSARNMGAGFFPRWVAILLLVLGAFIALRGLVVDGPRLERIAWPFALPILASVILFGLAVTQLGLLLTVALSVAVAAVAGRGYRRSEIVLLAVGMSLFCALLFVWGLSLPLDLLPPRLQI